MNTVRPRKGGEGKAAGRRGRGARGTFEEKGECARRGKRIPTEVKETSVKDVLSSVTLKTRKLNKVSAFDKVPEK